MADGDQRYWKRVGHVSINGVDYGSGENALDFRFRIRKVLAAQRFEASIGILGLSMESIHELSCWQPWNVAVAKKRQIEVYAGYEDEGEKLLFTGYIYEARPTSPPNMWLEIKADNLAYLDNKYMQDGKRGKVMFKKLVQQLAAKARFADGSKLALQIADDVKDKTLNCPMFDSTTNTLPQYIESLHDVYAYIDNHCLYVVKRDPENPPTMRGKFELNADSGLLGIQKLDWSELTARMRLDTQLGLNDLVEIKSELYPENASGAYLVNTVEYNGHLRGQEWETVIHAWNYTKESRGSGKELRQKSGK